MNNSIRNAKIIIDIIEKEFKGNVYIFSFAYIIARVAEELFFNNEPLLAKYYYLKSLEYYEIPILYTNLGLIYSDFNEFDSAYYYYKKSIDLMPNDETANNNFGTFYYYNKDYIKAKFFYEKAIKINSKYPAPYFNLALIFERIDKNYSLAKEYYLMVTKLNVNEADCFNNLRYLYQHKFNQPDSAIFYYNKAIETDSEFVMSYVNLGDVYRLVKKNYGYSKFYYKEAIKINPSFSNAFNHLGNLYMNNLNNYDSAAICYRLSINADSSNAVVWCNLGILYLDHLKDLDLSLYYLNRSIEIKSDYAMAYCKMGDFYREKKDCDSSIYFYKKAIFYDDNFFEAHHNLAAVELMVCFPERKIESEQNLLKALELKPNSAQTLLMYAELLKKRFKG